MPAVDLGLEYRGGVNVPVPQDEGAVAFVAPPDGDGALNFRYGNAAKPKALDGVDTFDLYPRVFRTTTPNASPLHIATISVPDNFDLELLVSAIATDGDDDRREYVRGRFQNRAIGPITNLYGGTGLVAVEAAFGTLSVASPAISRVLITDAVQVYVTGLAGVVHWTVSIQGRLTRIFTP